MGTDKNIKLHIVTDIKILDVNGINTLIIMVELCEEDQKMTYEKLVAMKHCILLWRQRDQDQETRLLQEIKNEEEEIEKVWENKKLTCEKIYEEIDKKSVELCNLRKDMSKMEEKLNMLKELRDNEIKWIPREVKFRKK